MPREPKTCHSHECLWFQWTVCRQCRVASWQSRTRIHFHGPSPAPASRGWRLTLGSRHASLAAVGGDCVLHQDLLPLWCPEACDLSGDLLHRKAAASKLFLILELGLGSDPRLCRPVLARDSASLLIPKQSRVLRDYRRRLSILYCPVEC